MKDRHAGGIVAHEFGHSIGNTMIAAPFTLRHAILIGSVAVAGCGEGQATKAARQASMDPTRPVRSAPGRPALADWDARRCGDDEYKNAAMQRHPELIGRSPEELTAAFGKPADTDHFRAGETQGTFRAGVADQLPGGAAANANRVVKEMTWTRSGCNFTVQFYERQARWRAIDGFEWSVGADF